MSKIEVVNVVQEPRDFAETGGKSALIGCGAWLAFALGLSLFYVAFQGVSFDDAFPPALKFGAIGGALVALVVAFGFVRLRATIKFSEKKDFVIHLNLAASQLGYAAAAIMGDIMTFRPSFQTGGVGLGMVTVQLQDDHATVFGPKMHVMKIVKRMETV